MMKQQVLMLKMQMNAKLEEQSDVEIRQVVDMLGSRIPNLNKEKLFQDVRNSVRKELAETAEADLNRDITADDVRANCCLLLMGCACSFCVASNDLCVRVLACLHVYGCLGGGVGAADEGAGGGGTQETVAIPGQHHDPRHPAGEGGAGARAGRTATATAAPAAATRAQCGSVRQQHNHDHAHRASDTEGIDGREQQQHGRQGGRRSPERLASVLLIVVSSSCKGTTSP